MRHRGNGIGIGIALVALLAGCTVGPDFAPPGPPPPAAGYATDGGGRATIGQAPPPRWWTAFGSPALDALVDRALVANHSLEAARATLASARTRIAAARGRAGPQVEATARAERQQLNLSAFGLSGDSPFGPVGNPEFDLYSVGGGIRYDLDLFGRNRRTIEQARADAEAQAHETEAAHLTIAGRVVAQVLAIAALNDRIAATQALLAESERTAALTVRRREAGVGTLVEVLSAEGQLAADRAELPQLAQQLAEGRTMLAVLLGISPAELAPTPFRLDDFRLPARVPVAMPSALVHARPDILEAEARLHAATAAIGVATARLYPDITLGASVTQSNSALGNVLGGNARGYDIFAALTAPIFDGGTLRAQRRGAQADARAAAATYRQTVTEAFGQVSALLSALENDDRALTVQREATAITERSRRLSRRSFAVGNSGILQTLDANRTAQRASLALIDARARQAQDIGRLYVATAGGFALAEQVGAEQVAAASIVPAAVKR